MIFFSIYQMMQVFTGASPPPNLFSFSDIYFPAPGQAEMVLITSGQELNKLVAMVFWYMLNFFIMWSGGKIASLGINMMREIKVEPQKYKSEKAKEVNNKNLK